MSEAMQRIWYRLIHKGLKTVNDVPTKSQELVRAMYKKMYGIEI